MVRRPDGHTESGPGRTLRDLITRGAVKPARFATLVLVSAVTALSACTISRPRGEAHLSALAEGDRHAGHGRLEQAERAYAEATRTAERRVDRDEAAYRRARILIQQEKWADAVRLLDALAAKRPVSRRTPRALFEASLIRMDELGERDAAMAGFEQVIRLYPDDGNGGRALYLRLAPFREADDTAGAVAFLDALYPDVQATTLGDDVLRQKADLLLGDGERAEARATLELLVRNHPYPQGHRWDDALMTLADMDIEDGRPEDAIAHLRTLVAVQETTTMVGGYTLPTFARAQMRIAQIYRNDLEDRDAADREYRVMYDQFVRSSLRDDALYERGEMWLDAGDVRRGCRILRRVVDEFEVGHARRSAEARIAADCAERSAAAPPRR